MPSWGVLPRVRIVKGSLFAGLAFVRVMILNILKSNGISCPCRSSKSPWQPADLPYSVQEWNTRGELSTSVLLPKSRRFTKPWGGALLAYSIIFPFHFARCNRSRKLFSNMQCLVCILGRFWESVLSCHGTYTCIYIWYVRCTYMFMHSYVCTMYIVHTYMHRYWYMFGHSTSVQLHNHTSFPNRPDQPCDAG